jgi:peptide/nickel transport system substrate-binding protein
MALAPRKKLELAGEGRKCFHLCMRFAVLGPLAVSPDGYPVSLGGRKQQTLLAVLLLHANEVVSRDRLIDALWGESPPPSTAESLDTYIYRLRKLLGRDRLARQPGGYLLRVEPGELDVDQFELLLASADCASQMGDHRAASATLTEALALWRGPAWADMLDEPSVNSEAQRLEELRLSALESRIEAELATGGGVELVPELKQLVGEHPLRERLLSCLMLAFYRAGRQTDALDTYQSARRRLIEELGLEPGPGLHELQQRILQHDPTLGKPRRLVAPANSHARRLLAAAIVVAVTAAVSVGVVVASGTARARRALLAGNNGLAAVDTRSDGVTSVTPLSGAPGAVAGGAGSVWATDPGSAAVLRIHPATGAVVGRIPVGGQPGSIVTSGGAVWAASTVGATVTRIDPATETVTQTISLPGSGLGEMASGAGKVWVTDPAGHDLFEIDPATGSLQRTLPLDLLPSAVAVGDGAVWVAGYSSATVEKLDPASGRVMARVRVGNGPAALVFAAGSLWVANSLDSTVSRVDPAALRVRALIPAASGPAALAAGMGSVWVGDQYSGTVSRIDPRRDQVAASVAIGGAPTSLAMGGGRLWAGVAANGGSHRGGTLVIVAPGELTGPYVLSSVDPAFYDGVLNPQFTGLAYDALVNFQQSPGAAGMRLVPDLALAIPAAADGGRTYVFRVRPGIRYSDGQPLRAGDFRRGMERLFRVHSPGTSYFTGIVGAAACTRRPATCDLSRGIVTDDARGSVVFHLTAPDPDFLFKLTQFAFGAPVPPGTPDHETGAHFVPGTGPYKIVSASGTQIRFARNPYFREWSHAAQPAGNPDGIVWRSVPTAQDGVAAVEHGQADWVSGLIPRAQYRQLSLQAPAQLHSSPEFTVDFAPINTHRAPFNDVRVRQALNYAINRRAIVRLYGGPAFATATCQVIIPGLPGYRRHCPYTVHPRADGAYTGPDLARARRLVAESGTSGARVDLWGESTGYVPPTVPGYVAGVLHALGYRVHLHVIPFPRLTPGMQRGFQLSTGGDWSVNYPDPSSYVPQFFGCGGGNSNGYYCNGRLDREMKAAELLELSDPARASARWESIDHQLTDNAIWVPTVNEREVDFVSKRLHNYEFNPVWGFLADQAWLRKPLSQTQEHPAHSPPPANPSGNQSPPFTTMMH